MPNKFICGHPTSAIALSKIVSSFGFLVGKVINWSPLLTVNWVLQFCNTPCPPTPMTESFSCSNFFLCKVVASRALTGSPKELIPLFTLPVGCRNRIYAALTKFTIDSEGKAGKQSSEGYESQVLQLVQPQIINVSNSKIKKCREQNSDEFRPRPTSPAHK